MRALSKIVATGAIAATALGIGIGTAIADPSAQPATTDIVGVGSDTITPLFTQFSTDYNSGIASTAPHLYSWNAVAPSGVVPTTIQTKGAASTDPNCSITRPNGSGAGISALETTGTTGDGHPCVDFARSSRKRATTDPTTIVFDAIAQDAISWAATDPSKGGNVPAGTSLTLAQLGQIYTCQSDGSSYTWADILGSGFSTDAIVPILPQNGSGTRSTFLSDIGVTTPGACVVNASGTTAIEENEGTNAAFFESGGTTPNPDVIFPYSVGEYIAQVDTLADTSQAPGDLLPQDLTNTVSGAKVFPISGTGSSAVIATGLPTAAYRLLYVVTPNSSTTGKALPTNLVGLFGNVSQSGWICTNATAKADITKFGFRNLGSSCGALS